MLMRTVLPVNITREEALQIGGEFYFFPGTDVAQIEYVAKEEGGCILLTISQGVVCSYAALFGRRPFYLLVFLGSFLPLA